jgi:hypothetical protein
VARQPNTWLSSPTHGHAQGQTLLHRDAVTPCRRPLARRRPPPARSRLLSATFLRSLPPVPRLDGSSTSASCCPVGAHLGSCRARWRSSLLCAAGLQLRVSFARPETSPRSRPPAPTSRIGKKATTPYTETSISSWLAW